MRSSRRAPRFVWCVYLVVAVGLATGCSGQFEPGTNNVSHNADNDDGGRDHDEAQSTPNPPTPGDNDGDGFRAADGDCNDNDPRVNPAAIEVAGIACREHGDCASNRCVSGVCRCIDDNMCSSNSACQSDSQCKTPGEKCSDAKCCSSYKCLAAQPGLGTPELKVCRDDIDNNCDGNSDELPVACDSGNLDPSNPRSYGAALGLCDSNRACDAQGQCPGGMACVNGRCSHLVSAVFEGQSPPQGRSIAQRLAQASSALGTPRQGKSMVLLSTGRAIYNAQSDLECPQPGTTLGTHGSDPDPKANDRQANDMQALTLRIVVPSNAHGFSFDFHFLTTEYPEYLDSEFKKTASAASAAAAAAAAAATQATAAYRPTAAPLAG